MTGLIPWIITVVFCLIWFGYAYAKDNSAMAAQALILAMIGLQLAEIAFYLRQAWLRERFPRRLAPPAPTRKEPWSQTERTPQ